MLFQMKPSNPHISAYKIRTYYSALQCAASLMESNGRQQQQRWSVTE